MEPGKQYTATVYAYDPNGDVISYDWSIFKEVKERSQGGARENAPDPVSFTRIKEDDGSLSFLAPAEAGDYRLFVYVFDEANKAGYANIPFYVK